MHPQTIFDNRVDAARLDGAAAAVLGRDKTELELLEAFVAVHPSQEQVVVELTGDGALELVASENEGSVLFDEGLGNTARPARIRLDYARKKIQKIKMRAKWVVITRACVLRIKRVRCA